MCAVSCHLTRRRERGRAKRLIEYNNLTTYSTRCHGSQYAVTNKSYFHPANALLGDMKRVLVYKLGPNHDTPDNWTLLHTAFLSANSKIMGSVRLLCAPGQIRAHRVLFPFVPTSIRVQVSAILVTGARKDSRSDSPQKVYSNACIVNAHAK